MTNYCGSEAPEHRAYRCKPCQAKRQRERRQRIRDGIRYLGPSCAICGLAQRNRYGNKVYRYYQLRTIRASHTKTGWTNKQVATVPLCDRCLIEGGYAREQYVRKAA